MNLYKWITDGDVLDAIAAIVLMITITLFLAWVRG